MSMWQLNRGSQQKHEKATAKNFSHINASQLQSKIAPLQQNIDSEVQNLRRFLSTCTYTSKIQLNTDTDTQIKKTVTGIYADRHI